MTCTGYAEETASESPAPGGGSISAYMGALAAALGTMVANLSSHKAGWDDRWEYFSNWARVWCQKAKPEYQQMLLSVDVHGPAILRANMPPRNFAEWYSTFNVNESDKMYIAPDKRIVIW
mgnify:CR=1 FL=1